MATRRNGVRSREKGKAYEREVVHELKPLFPGAKRSVNQSRNGGQYEDFKADVEGTPYWVECCHAHTPSVVGKLAQAKASTDGRKCLAVTKQDRQPSVASMYLEDFKALLRDVEVLRVMRVEHPKLVEAAEGAVLERGQKHIVAEEAALEEKPKTFKIFVNGKLTETACVELSYEEVVRLAFPTVHPYATSGVGFTVTYRHSASQKSAGALTATDGLVVRLKDGTVFNVARTGSA